MKSLLMPGLALWLVAAGPLQAASKPCEELKQEIAAKLEARGVHEYQLEITRPGGANGWTVVGACEGGSREILYRRGTSDTLDMPADAPPSIDGGPDRTLDPPADPIRPLP